MLYTALLNALLKGPITLAKLLLLLWQMLSSQLVGWRLASACQHLLKRSAPVPLPGILFIAVAACVFCRGPQPLVVVLKFNMSCMYARFFLSAKSVCLLAIQR